MPFGLYAQYYDVFYTKKNYAKECDYIEKLFRLSAKKGFKNFLDLGCGTGNHMIPLLKRGYTGVGIDRSAKMLRQAHKKTASVGLTGTFVKSGLKEFEIHRKFDLVMCMFSVIDYITRSGDIRSMLASVRRHMKPDGLFIFDFWQASALNRLYTPVKSAWYKKNGFRIERSSRTKLLKGKNLCEVGYTCRVLDGTKKVHQFSEKHRLRAFAVEEMIAFLDEAGLDVVRVCPFMKPDATVRKNTWDITFVVKKKRS